MSISLCMIALNEAEILPACLAAAQGLYDELIVVVDSRTTDLTAEIVEAHGGRVRRFEYVAPGHKGKARQMGIDAALGDWIVVLDADETIIDPAKLRAEIDGAAHDVDGFNVRFENVDGNGVTLVWYQMRVFRAGRFRYMHREHEIPVRTFDREAVDLYSDVTFLHRPPAGREGPKVGPMLQRLLLDVQEHPGDPHSLYMCARQHAHAGNFAEAIAMVGQYLTLPGANLLSDACRLAGICRNYAGDRSGMYQWMHRATAYEPERRLLWIELAQMYYDDQRYSMALALARMAAELTLLHQQREMQPCEDLTYICGFIEMCRAHYHTH